MSFKFDYFLTCFPKLLQALPLTLKMTVISMAASIVLGILLAVLSLSKNNVVRTICRAYIGFIRSIPILILLLVNYFAVPALFKGIGIDLSVWTKVTFAIITFSICFSVLCSEVFRSAYEAIDKGQAEAAKSIGMSNWQALRRIIIPQAFYICIPNVFNQFITLFKDTSLAFTLGVVDLMGKAKILDANTYGVRRLEIFLAVAVVYWVLTKILELASSALERSLSKGSKGMAVIQQAKGRR